MLSMVIIGTTTVGAIAVLFALAGAGLTLLGCIVLIGSVAGMPHTAANLQSALVVTPVSAIFALGCNTIRKYMNRLNERIVGS